MNALLFQLLIAAMLSWVHPYYVSMTEIEHNKASHSIEISVRIFTDDLEKILRRNYTGKVDLLDKNEKSNSEKLIQQYILKHLLLKADGKALTLNFAGYESEEGSIWSYFECPNVTTVKTLEVNNTLLYDYKEEQINFIRVKAPGYDETARLYYPEGYKQFSLQ